MPTSTCKIHSAVPATHTAAMPSIEKQTDGSYTEHVPLWAGAGTPMDSHARDCDPDLLVAAQWRVGRSLGRTIYAMVGDSASKRDILLGIWETADLATFVVEQHNRTRGDWADR